MQDFAYIKPMDNNGQLSVNNVAVKSLAKLNVGTSDMDVHHNENLTRLDLDWTPTPEVSVRNIASFIHGDRVWHMGATALGYRPETNDVVRSFFGDWTQSQDQWGNQINLTWRRPLAGRLNSVVVGNAVDRMDYTRIVTLWPGKVDIVPLFGPPKSGAYPSTGAEIGPAANHLVTRVSAFAEDRLQVTPRVSLVGGLRFDHQDFDRIDLVTPVRSQVSRTDDVFNYRAGSVFTVARNTNVYAQYSVATDGPDYLLCCGSAANVRELKPTRGRQVEVGIKQSASNGRVDWTVAGYRIAKTDLLIFDRTSTGEGRYIQAGGQSSRGVEATIALNLGAGLQVAASGTVLKPVFDELIEADENGLPVSRTGNKPPNVPWKSGNLLAT
jgi:iron complex outermembrane receptor protein